MNFGSNLHRRLQAGDPSIRPVHRCLIRLKQLHVKAREEGG
jgi:hypothetical protein